MRLTFVFLASTGLLASLALAAPLAPRQDPAAAADIPQDAADPDTVDQDAVDPQDLEDDKPQFLTALLEAYYLKQSESGRMEQMMNDLDTTLEELQVDFSLDEGEKGSSNATDIPSEVVSNIAPRADTDTVTDTVDKVVKIVDDAVDSASGATEETTAATEAVKTKRDGEKKQEEKKQDEQPQQEQQQPPVEEDGPLTKEQQEAFAAAEVAFEKAVMHAQVVSAIGEMAAAWNATCTKTGCKHADVRAEAQRCVDEAAGDERVKWKDVDEVTVVSEYLPESCQKILQEWKGMRDGQKEEDLKNEFRLEFLEGGGVKIFEQQ